MKQLAYIDLHVAGEPFRLITSGLPEICGETMAEKRIYAIEHLDNIRKLVLLEPRGHADMYGGFLTPPVHDGSDLGIVFIHGSGMSTMCGHGVIALARAAVELGIVSLCDGTVPIRIDAPSGTVDLTVYANGEKVQSIAFQNRLSFPYAVGQQIKTPSYGTITVDIGYGGAFMIFADIRQFNIALDADNVSTMLSIAMECGEAAISQLNLVHPSDPSKSAKANGICMILADYLSLTEKEIYSRTFTVFGRSQFDRSPTGTGTAALAAVLWKKGYLHPEQTLINTGISGIPFRVTIDVFGEQIIPTIYSNAYVTGKGHVILEDDDPLQEGIFIKASDAGEI